MLGLARDNQLFSCVFSHPVAPGFEYSVWLARSALDYDLN